MREIIDLMKELLMIKREDKSVVGLSGFKKVSKPIAKKPVKKAPKEVKISDLMRRNSKLA